LTRWSRAGMKSVVHSLLNIIFSFIIILSSRTKWKSRPRGKISLFTIVTWRPRWLKYIPGGASHYTRWLTSVNIWLSLLMAESETFSPTLLIASIFHEDHHTLEFCYESEHVALLMPVVEPLGFTASRISSSTPPPPVVSAKLSFS